MKTDRPLSSETLKAKQHKRFLKLGFAVVSVLILGYILREVLQPGISADYVRTAVAERGDVMATIQATGLVVPEAEQVIPCPFDARLKTVLRDAGAGLEPGQLMLELDDSEILAEVEALKDETALTQNRIEQLQTELVGKTNDYDSRIEVANLRSEHLRTKTEQQRYLQTISAATAWNVRDAELDENIAKIEQEQLVAQKERLIAETQKQIEGLEIERRLLRSKLEISDAKLKQAGIRADRAGVLIWIATEQGSMLREGEIIARVADLTRFRIEASVSDMHATRLALEMPVIIEVNGEALSGRIIGVPPAVTQGRVTVIIGLDQPSYSALRPNMRVDVQIITDRKQNVLRVKKGPFVKGSGQQDVFVLKDGDAFRIRATVGTVGVDYVEIKDGIEPGETVLISDMEDYKHLKKVRIN
ncbi:efflux RND transporter periplasmic adaptor subunit [bacterium]|nr:efflux RND transporter periplasmic adaptor subunit [bacterium]